MRTLLILQSFRGASQRRFQKLSRGGSECHGCLDGFGCEVCWMDGFDGRTRGFALGSKTSSTFCTCTSALVVVADDFAVTALQDGWIFNDDS